jgi:hypothetical protein
VVECDLAKVEVAGSNPVSRSRFRKSPSGALFLLWEVKPAVDLYRSLASFLVGRGTQVVRERSAKPLYVSSILTRASNYYASI